MKNTSWGKEIVWGEYQKELILPNLRRLMELKNNEVVLDLGCGAGFFAREFAKSGSKIIGADISLELIEQAKRNSPKNIQYYTAPAHKLGFLKNQSVDKIAIILAIQNMENVHEVLKECGRLLKANGRMFLVMNHPAFRIPKRSSWGWDMDNKIQYRRVESYLSESKEKIEMHPGEKPSETTLSFHRPLQFYFKALNKNGFSVSRLEEWNSHKKSELGPRSKAEDIARKEIPMFLFLEAIKSN
ncbi:MAG: class I SAM-dependent methyltransferase [Patescibacteria group bacterium]